MGARQAAAVSEPHWWGSAGCAAGGPLLAGSLPPTSRRCSLATYPSVARSRRRRRDLAAAIWRPELGLAEVVLQRGKVLAHMGFTRGAKLLLFPEEAA